MSNSIIRKSDWLSAQTCVSQAWFSRRADHAKPNEAGLFRMEQGREIGELAHELYPAGIKIHSLDMEAATAETTALMEDSAVDVLFEAAFTADGLVARADILKREADGWHVLEVKSSFSDSSSLDDLVADLTYTVAVLERAGLSVSKASLVLLSREFRHGDPTSKLFTIIDKTAEVTLGVTSFEAVVESIKGDLLADNQPISALISACRSCDFFRSDCLGSNVAHSILEIPGLHHTKLKLLSIAGIVDVSHLPAGFVLNERQQRALDAIVSNAVVVNQVLMERSVRSHGRAIT